MINNRFETIVQTNLSSHVQHNEVKRCLWNDAKSQTGARIENSCHEANSYGTRCRTIPTPGLELIVFFDVINWTEQTDFQTQNRYFGLKNSTRHTFAQINPSHLAEELHRQELTTLVANDSSSNVQDRRY